MRMDTAFKLFRCRTLVTACVFFCLASISPACPFCSALPHTLSDDLEECVAAVVARCESVSVASNGVHACRLRISDVIKGRPQVSDSVIEVESAQRLEQGRAFWLVRFSEDDSSWTPPVSLSADAISYLRHLGKLPDTGSERLRYFLTFIKHPDEFIAVDAYNEFAEASIDDISKLKGDLDRNWIISQINDASVPIHRRRLCWTLLSQCAIAADARLFDESIRKRQVDSDFDPGMDAAIACLITLGGEQALARVEREYLSNQAADYSDCFAAIHAIRVHGTELNVLPRARLASALRLVLDRPTLADLVLPDLARWEDWSAIDRVVQLFQRSTQETELLKGAIVRYLKACPLPKATEAVEKLRRIDAEAVQFAETSMMFYSGLPTIPVPPPETKPTAEKQLSPLRITDQSAKRKRE